MEKDLKLSPKERELLEPFYETDVFNLALKPVLQRWGNGIARTSAEGATWEQVLVNRGKLQAIKAINAQIKRWNEDGRKRRETKR